MIIFSPDSLVRIFKSVPHIIQHNDRRRSWTIQGKMLRKRFLRPCARTIQPTSCEVLSGHLQVSTNPQAESHGSQQAEGGWVLLPGLCR